MRESVRNKTKAIFNFNKVYITFINANLMHFMPVGWKEAERKIQMMVKAYVKMKFKSGIVSFLVDMSCCCPCFDAS